VRVGVARLRYRPPPLLVAVLERIAFPFRIAPLLERYGVNP